jgi:hypothetical protein
MALAGLAKTIMPSAPGIVVSNSPDEVYPTRRCRRQLVHGIHNFPFAVGARKNRIST